MTHDDETLGAYVDDELDAATRARLDAEMERDPALARRVQRQRALRETLRRHYDPVRDEPVPARLLPSLAATAAMGADAPARDPRADSATVVALPAPRRDPARRAPGWSWPHWAGMAASLLAGILVAQWFGGAGSAAGDGASLVASRDGVYATGSLATALSTQPSGVGAAAADAPVRIALSFRARDTGAYCRSFVGRGSAAGAALSGLACRDGERWRIEALADTAVASPGGEYRQATTALPPAVTAAIESTIDGEPFDATAERAALRAGWRPQR